MNKIMRKSILILAMIFSVFLVTELGVISPTQKVEAADTKYNDGSDWCYGTDYGHPWAWWGQLNQYSNYYRPYNIHRSSTYENGVYSFSDGGNKDHLIWHRANDWSQCGAPWVNTMYTYNSYAH